MPSHFSPPDLPLISTCVSCLALSQVKPTRFIVTEFIREEAEIFDPAVFARVGSVHWTHRQDGVKATGIDLYTPFRVTDHTRPTSDGNLDLGSKPHVYSWLNQHLWASRSSCWKDNLISLVSLINGDYEWPCHWIQPGPFVSGVVPHRR